MFKIGSIKLINSSSLNIFSTEGGVSGVVSLLWLCSCSTLKSKKKQDGRRHRYRNRMIHRKRQTTNERFLLVKSCLRICSPYISRRLLDASFIMNLMVDNVWITIPLIYTDVAIWWDVRKPFLMQIDFCSQESLD